MIDNVEKKTILVTGAAGFIGSFLSKALLELNYDVIGIDNLNEYYDIKLKRGRLKMLDTYEDFSFQKADIENKKIN